MFVGSSLLAGADPVPDTSVQVVTPPETPQAVVKVSPIVGALQKLSLSLERLVAVLSIIKDKPTAELHAFDVGNLFIEYETSWSEYSAMADGMSVAEMQSLAPDVYRRYDFFNKQFHVQRRRIARADHYESLDLRTAMGETVEEHETEPEKEQPLLPDTHVQQLAASVAKAQALYLSRNRNVQGGPGFTRETAWIMLDPKMSVIAQEYEIMKQVIRETADRQSLVYEGERWYDLLEYDVKVDGVTYTVDQWFDITLHADTMNAKAQAGPTPQAPQPAAPPAAVSGKSSLPTGSVTPEPPPVVVPAAVIPPTVAPATALPAEAVPTDAAPTEPAPTTKKVKSSRSGETGPAPVTAPAPALETAPAPATPQLQPTAPATKTAPNTIKQTDLIIST